MLREHFERRGSREGPQLWSGVPCFSGWSLLVSPFTTAVHVLCLQLFQDSVPLTGSSQALQVCLRYHRSSQHRPAALFTGLISCVQQANCTRAPFFCDLLVILVIPIRKFRCGSCRAYPNLIIHVHFTNGNHMSVFTHAHYSCKHPQFWTSRGAAVITTDELRIICSAV